jgi:hypothetical protein
MYRFAPGLGQVVLLMGFSLGAACDKRDEPKPAGVPDPNGAPPVVASATPAAPAPASTESVVWAEPKGWRRVSGADGIRKVTYAVPKAAGDSEDGELTVSHFGQNMGGSVQDNVERWTKQFSDTNPAQIKRDQRSSNGLVQHTLEIGSGTYASGKPGGPTTPKPGYALLAAIVETPSGSYFFKLTGPRNTLQRERGQFFELLDSVKAK